MIEEVGPNIQHTSGVANIVADTISILPSKYFDKYETITRKDQCRANELFLISRSENNKYCFPLNLLNVKKITTKIS